MYSNKIALLILAFSLQQAARPVDDSTIKSIINDPKAIVTNSTDSIAAPTTGTSSTTTTIAKEPQPEAETAISPAAPATGSMVPAPPGQDPYPPFRKDAIAVTPRSFFPPRPTQIDGSTPVYQPGEEPQEIQSDDEISDDRRGEITRDFKRSPDQPMEDEIEPFRFGANLKWRDGMEQNQGVPFIGPISIGAFPGMPNQPEEEGRPWRKGRFNDDDRQDDMFKGINSSKLNEKIKEARARLDKAEEALTRTSDAKKASTESADLKKALDAKNQSIKDYKFALARYQSSKVFFEDKDAFDEYQKASFMYSKLTRMLSRQNR